MAKVVVSEVITFINQTAATVRHRSVFVKIRLLSTSKNSHFDTMGYKKCNELNMAVCLLKILMIM